jgi:hypothetical protein
MITVFDSSNVEVMIISENSRARQKRTRSTGQCRTGQHRSRQKMVIQNKKEQNRTGQGRAGQGRARSSFGSQLTSSISSPSSAMQVATSTLVSPRLNDYNAM